MAKKKRTEAKQPEPTPGVEGEVAAGVEDTGLAVDEETPVRQLASREAEITQLKERLLYVQADLDNFKRRTEKRLRDSLEYSGEPIFQDLLPVLDNLQRAVDHADDTGAGGLAGLVEGLGHVIQQFREALERHGVEPVPGEGESFDPTVHEAMLQVFGEEDGKVGKVFEKGYRLKGRLLRPSKVSVTKLAPPGGDG